MRRIPIIREVEAGAGDNDPDHIRGAKYANLLLGTDYGRGDVIQMIYLDRVEPGYFERVEAERPEVADNPLYGSFRRDPDVICVDDLGLLPPEYHRLPPERDPLCIEEDGGEA